MAKMFTAKHITGFVKAGGPNPGMNGTCFNDAYNVAQFGITAAQYGAMRTYLGDRYGYPLPSLAECLKDLRAANL